MVDQYKLQMRLVQFPTPAPSEDTDLSVQQYITSRDTVGMQH
jgi:hypothetical protein